VTSVVGIDLGGTKVAAAVLRDRDLGESATQPTRVDSRDGLIEQLVGMVGEALGAAPGKPDAVGIGVPSIIEFATGRVVSSVNVPLTDVPLRQVLGDRLGVPVFVDNDATVAALAEAHDEELQLVSRNLVMLTVGTGLGGGIVLGGRIFRGATGGAGEFGHTLVCVPVDPDVPPASERFPQAGSLESVASGHALDRTGAGGMTGAEIVRSAGDGDESAGAAVRRWAHAVGIGVANAINTFDPEEVVIGGGGAAAGELLLGPAREIAESYIHPGLRGHATVRLARHGVRAGVLGAALLAEHELTAGALDPGNELSGRAA